MKTPLAFSVFLATTIVTAVRPEVADVSTSVPFSENGVIVSMEEFFHVVKTKGAGSNESGTTSRALATATAYEACRHKLEFEIPEHERVTQSVPEPSLRIGIESSLTLHWRAQAAAAHVPRREGPADRAQLGRRCGSAIPSPPPFCVGLVVSAVLLVRDELISTAVCSAPLPIRPCRLS